MTRQQRFILRGFVTSVVVILTIWNILVPYGMQGALLTVGMWICLIGVWRTTPPVSD